MTNSFAGAGQQGAVPFTATMRHAVTPGTSRLDISIEDLGRTRWLCLRGTLDTASGACAYDTIVASAAAPARQLHLDLNGLDAATRAAAAPSTSRPSCCRPAAAA